jgi:hypothetical protein
MDYSSIKVHTLLNSRISACFIDNFFVDFHKLLLVTKKYYIPVEVIDGRPLVSGDVTHETTLLDMILEGHHNIIAFNVIKSPSNPVVLGFS